MAHQQNSNGPNATPTASAMAVDDSFARMAFQAQDERRTELLNVINPNSPDVAPMVTMQLTGMAFQPLTGMLFGVAMGMPDVAALPSLEDRSGAVSALRNR